MIKWYYYLVKYKLAGLLCFIIGHQWEEQEVDGLQMNQPVSIKFSECKRCKKFKKGINND
jgi:hypothetical protein